jgi:hypothetical protein
VFRRGDYYYRVVDGVEVPFYGEAKEYFKTLGTSYRVLVIVHGYLAGIKWFTGDGEIQGELWFDELGRTSQTVRYESGVLKSVGYFRDGERVESSV